MLTNYNAISKNDSQIVLELENRLTAFVLAGMLQERDTPEKWKRNAMAIANRIIKAVLGGFRSKDDNVYRGYLGMFHDAHEKAKSLNTQPKTVRIIAPLKANNLTRFNISKGELLVNDKRHSDLELLLAEDTVMHAPYWSVGFGVMTDIEGQQSPRIDPSTFDSVGVFGANAPKVFQAYMFGHVNIRVGTHMVVTNKPMRDFYMCPSTQATVANVDIQNERAGLSAFSPLANSPLLLGGNYTEVEMVVPHNNLVWQGNRPNNERMVAILECRGAATTSSVDFIKNIVAHEFSRN